MIEIERFVDKRAGYSSVHVIKTILLIGERSIGRDRLMKELSLNEASVRTILNRLTDNKIIKPAGKGKVLSKRGDKIFQFLKKNIVGPREVEKTNITMSRYNVAYLVKKRAHKIKRGLEQRDQAVKIDAEGLTTLVYRKGLSIPGLGWDVPRHIDKLFELERGDVVLIGSAKSRDRAELAALSAALELL